MKINKKKTKYLVIGGKDEKINLRIGSEQIEQVEKFKYLGSIIALLFHRDKDQNSHRKGGI